MTDSFDQYTDAPNSPSRAMRSVVPNDAVPLPLLPKALYVGTGGDVALRCVDDDTDVVFRNVPSGALIRARALFVRATGTTAADILAHC